uniref:Energy-coupling factor transporter transmembrane protein EcfT n=1 Tax=Ignisphaera aggregans TaxID=334771 RepID=A0A7C2ZBM5_9CREN
MSVAKAFSSIFICSRRSSLSLHARIALPTMLAILSMVSMVFPERGIIFVIYGYTVTIMALHRVKSLGKAIRGLMLPLLFIIIGLLMHMLSRFLGYPSPSIYSLVLSSLKISLMFLSMTLFFQWVCIRELRYILARIKLERISALLTLSLAIIPIIFNMYSESYTAAMLKFGKRKVYKAVKPLVIQTAILSRDVSQALYLYGFPSSYNIEVKTPTAKEIALIGMAASGGLATLLLFP